LIDDFSSNWQDWYLLAEHSDDEVADVYRGECQHEALDCKSHL
jgi:hypothetical protein